MIDVLPPVPMSPSFPQKQMEFDGIGRGSSRRRRQVPTLGPLSYSLPVTPRGREEHTSIRDGEKKRKISPEGKGGVLVAEEARGGGG